MQGKIYQSGHHELNSNERMHNPYTSMYITEKFMDVDEGQLFN